MSVVHRFIEDGGNNDDEFAQNNVASEPIYPQARRDQGGYLQVARVGMLGGEEFRMQGRLADDANWIQLGLVTASGAATNDESFDGLGWYGDTFLAKSYPMLPQMRFRCQNAGGGFFRAWMVE